VVKRQTADARSAVTKKIPLSSMTIPPSLIVLAFIIIALANSFGTQTSLRTGHFSTRTYLSDHVTASPDIISPLWESIKEEARHIAATDIKASGIMTNCILSFESFGK
jgi:hypothetical protein